MADEKTHPLLHKPLFIFSLPEELLSTLTLKGDANLEVDETSSTPTENGGEDGASGDVGCSTCNINTFESVTQQREHVRSDLHKFNLKRKLSGQKVVTGDEFEKMLDGMSLPRYV